MSLSFSSMLSKEKGVILAFKDGNIPKIFSLNSINLKNRSLNSWFIFKPSCSIALLISLISFYQFSNLFFSNIIFYISLNSVSNSAKATGVSKSSSIASIILFSAFSICAIKSLSCFDFASANSASFTFLIVFINLL